MAMRSINSNRALSLRRFSSLAVAKVWLSAYLYSASEGPLDSRCNLVIKEDLQDSETAYLVDSSA